MRKSTPGCWKRWLALVGLSAGILSYWGCGKSTNSKNETFELSPKLLSLIPAATGQVNSTNLAERVAMLDRLVVIRRDDDVIGHEFPLDLPRSDYISIAKAVFSGGLRFQTNEEQTAHVLWKLTVVAKNYGLKELGPNFIPYRQFRIPACSPSR